MITLKIVKVKGSAFFLVAREFQLRPVLLLITTRSLPQTRAASVDLSGSYHHAEETVKQDWRARG